MFWRAGVRVPSFRLKKGEPLGAVSIRESGSQRAADRGDRAGRAPRFNCTASQLVSLPLWNPVHSSLAKAAAIRF
jgi:hypothetical protein